MRFAVRDSVAVDATRRFVRSASPRAVQIDADGRSDRKAVKSRRVVKGRARSQKVVRSRKVVKNRRVT